MASSREHAARPASPVRTRAVVLCAPGEPAPRALLDALNRRGVRPEPAHDPFGAARMLFTCGADGARPALIVVEPARQRPGPAEDLLRSVRRRLPGTSLWRYDPHARPPLRALAAGTFSDASNPHAHHAGGANGSGPVVVPSGSTSLPPALRLTEALPGEPPSPGALVSNGPREEAAPPQPSALLSEEELAMLLADDLDPPQTRPGDR